MALLSKPELLCEEFMRVYGHIPRWRLEADSWGQTVSLYHECQVKELQAFGRTDFTNDFIETAAKQQLAYWKHMMEGSLERELKNALGVIDTQPFYLVTINYPPEYSNWEYMNEVVKTIASFKTVVSVRHVHEYHGQGENHPHTHMLMRVTKKQKPSELVKLVYQAKGMSKQIGGSNFINVTKKPKTYEEYEEYIDGDKADEKLPNVALDRKWRAERGLV